MFVCARARVRACVRVRVPSQEVPPAKLLALTKSALVAGIGTGMVVGVLEPEGKGRSRGRTGLHRNRLSVTMRDV